MSYIAGPIINQYHHRYKYVVHGVIGEKQNQSVTVGSRCLKSDEQDTFLDMNFESRNVFIVLVVYAFYYD